MPFLCSSMRRYTGPGEINTDPKLPMDSVKNKIQSVSNLGSVALGVTSAALLASIPQGNY